MIMEDLFNWLEETVKSGYYVEFRVKRNPENSTFIRISAWLRKMLENGYCVNIRTDKQFF